MAASPRTVRSPKKERAAALNARYVQAEKASDALYYFWGRLHEEKFKRAIIFTITPQHRQDRAFMALVAPVVIEGKITILKKDINSLRHDLNKLFKTELKTAAINLSKRVGVGRNISGFSNPNVYQPELINFVRSIAILRPVVERMSLLNNSIANQTILNSMISSYIYDRTSTDRYSLVYYSRGNLDNIQTFVNAYRQGDPARGIPGDPNLNILPNVQSAQRAIFQEVLTAWANGDAAPAKRSTRDLEIVANYIGIKDKTRIPGAEGKKTKPINGQFIGADGKMLAALPNTFLAVKVKHPNFNESSFRTSNAGSLISVNVVPLASAANWTPAQQGALLNAQGTNKMPQEDRDLYIKYIVNATAGVKANRVDKKYKDKMKRSKTVVELDGFYNAAVANERTTNFPQLQAGMEAEKKVALAPPTATRIILDAEHQDLYLYRLELYYMALKRDIQQPLG